jgi:lipopolysaccharide/colanic/teichoic acid biosynthesis glycosyltransferase
VGVVLAEESLRYTGLDLDIIPLKDAAVGGDWLFWGAKRAFDLGLSIAALPIVAVVGLAILVLNPFWNPGRLFYTQQRMGRDQKPFTIFKFRTMRAAAMIDRGADDPVESERITPLGRFLRRMRFDELPQILNVLRGDMSLIGPRPDYIDHAREYARVIPAYALRHTIRPGISGYAQVTLGYAEGLELAAAKAKFDLYYIRNAGWRLELAVLAQTFRVMASGFGAR